jgi:predicted methyltransferase
MMKTFFKATLMAGTLMSASMGVNADFDAETEKKFDAVLAGKHRSEGNVARDKYRHPKATLEFFGVKPDMTVVEIWPGSYYTEILAPFLRDEGKYVAAVSSSMNGSARSRQSMARYLNLLAEKNDTLGATDITEFTYPDSLTTVEAGTADMVLTFRNVHNWMGRKGEYAILSAAFKALKPGGVLGVVEHRLDGGEGVEDGQNARRGYVREGYVIQVARSLGFEVVDASDANANPKDNKNHPSGVWTLPPTYALGEQDKEKYSAIGESDRFTLKFRKPEQTR